MIPQLVEFEYNFMNALMQNKEINWGAAVSVAIVSLSKNGCIQKLNGGYFVTKLGQACMKAYEAESE